MTFQDTALTTELWETRGEKGHILGTRFFCGFSFIEAKPYCQRVVSK